MKKRIQLFLLASLALGFSEFAPAAAISWNVANGDLGTSTNWNPNTSISTTGQTWTISNSGTATVSSGENYTLNSSLYVGDTAGKGTLSLNGNGVLTVSNIVSIGQQNAGGSSSVILNDTSKLLGGFGLYIGHRASGTLTISKGSQVDSGYLNLGDSSATANGTLNLSGTLNATGNVTLGSTSFTTEQATLNINAGSYFHSTGTLTVTSGSGAFLINLDGSGSTFSFDKAITANNSSLIFEFIADSGGVTTVTSALNINISDAVLKLNIDDYGSSSNLVLFSGSSITGTFSTIEWLGTDQGTVVYGADSIYVTVVPEPAAGAMAGLGLFAMGVAAAVARRRQRNARFPVV